MSRFSDEFTLKGSNGQKALVDANGNLLVSLGTKIAGEDTANDRLITARRHRLTHGATSAVLTATTTTPIYDVTAGYDLTGYENLTIYLVSTLDQGANVAIEYNQIGFGWTQPFPDYRSTVFTLPAGTSAVISKSQIALGLMRLKITPTVAPTTGNIKIFGEAF